MSEDLASAMKSILEEMKAILSPKIVFGEPLVMEDKTIIPVVRVSLGVGGGGGKGKEGSEIGLGGGGGGGISPVGIIVVIKGVPGLEGIKIMPFPSALGQALSELLPKMMETCMSMMAGKKPLKEEEKEKLLTV